MAMKLTADVTRETLEDTPRRVTQFLIGLSRRPTALTLMASHGFTPADKKQGWTLLMKVGDLDTTEEVKDEEVEQALAALDRWDEKGFRRVAIALYHFPEVRQTVMTGLTPKIGEEAAKGVAILLGRIERLKESKEGRAAYAMLAKRGIPDSELAHLAKLVAIVQANDKPARPSRAAADEAYLQALIELRHWYLEWSEVARLVITRRDHLILLGLASRRTTGATDVEGDTDVVEPTDEEDIDDVEDPTPFIDPNKPTT
jgi:hypothetical protein